MKKYRPDRDVSQLCLSATYVHALTAHSSQQQVNNVSQFVQRDRSQAKIHQKLIQSASAEWDLSYKAVVQG